MGRFKNFKNKFKNDNVTKKLHIWCALYKTRFGIKKDAKTSFV